MTRTVVITGCSSGFGRDVAQQLARKGDRVYATMRAPDVVVNNAGQMFVGFTEPRSSSPWESRRL
jgi:short-subunit dehydrogenase involved in D-alanine esterification of teichoic acids